MADNGITKEEMAELFARYMGDPKSSRTGAIEFSEKDFKKFKEAIAQSTEQLKKATPTISGAWAGFTKVSKETAEELKRFDEAIKKASEGTMSAEQTRKVAALAAQKEQYQAAAAHKKVADSAVNAAKGVADFAGQMIQGSMDFVKGLQDGADGATIATQAAKNAAAASFGAAKAASGLGSAIGDVAMMFGPWGIAIGLVTKALSGLVGFLAEKGQKLTEQAIQALGDELKKTEKGFKDINSTGALLGGGMTEMRKEAAKAGLDISTLAEAVKGSKEDLLGMGLGLGEATKRLASVSKELRNNPVGMELRKLGYSASEQAELSAQVMANMNAAGDKRVANEKAVAEETGKYGKDLKVLADITGQDAKKAMDKAREQAMEADLLAQAQAEGGAEAVEKLQRQLATMPEAMKKGYMEFVSTGGQAIADAGTNVAITQNPKIMEQYRAQYEALKDRNMDASKAQDQTAKLTEETAQYQRDHVREQRNMAQAARLASDSVSGGVKSAVGIQNALIMTNTKLGKGATAAARDAADKAAKNMSPLDVSVAELNDRTDKLKAALGKELTDAVTGFAESSAKGMETIDEALEKFGVETKGSKAKREAAAAKANASGAGGQRSSSAVGGASAMVGGAGGEGDAGAIMEAAGTATPAKAPAAGTESPAASGGGGKGSTPKLGKITSKSGKSASVGAEYVGPFQKLLDYLDSVGYNIDSLGGYVDRDVRGQPGVKSVHAKGGAIDINPGANPMGSKLITDFPSEIGKVAADLGLGWGGGWKSVKDAMHFSVAQNEGGTVKMYDAGGDITSGDVGIVGEKGPELVSGPASVTSRSETSEIFKKMNSNLEAMLKVLKDQHGTSEKILMASS